VVERIEAEEACTEVDTLETELARVELVRVRVP
jgi:hypothetical protein